MSTLSPIRTATALAVLVLVAACGRSPDADRPGQAPETEPDAADVAPSGRAAAPRDACELMTSREVAAFYGGDVEVVGVPDAGATWSSCHYTTPEDDFPFMELTVYWENGREEWRSWQAANGVAPSVMATPGVNVDSIIRPGPVAGLGDAAYYSSMLPSLILVGDRLLEIAIPLMPDAEMHFRTIGETLLSRLDR